MSNELIKFIKSMYGEDRFIPLHEPQFIGNEKKYLEECIDSTFVSSVGKFVDQLEETLCRYTKSNYTVATMNGTSALHIALVIADVKPDDEVLTQALSFVATSNAILYQGANPVFLDSSEDNMGLCPQDLEVFLEKFGEMKGDGSCYNKVTGRKIAACIPVHVFGHPAKMKQIIDICEKYNITVIEDAAESLGSFYHETHTGTIAPIGVLSFNGNKIVTGGSGGALLIKDKALASRAKHLTTTAKVPHQWDFYHNELGYNYRLPNINAALLCAQLEKLDEFIRNKRATANLYKEFFKSTNFEFLDEPNNCRSNFWLNAISCRDESQKVETLKELNKNGVMTRPIWKPLCDLPYLQSFQKSNLINTRNYEQKIVNIPSSVQI